MPILFSSISRGIIVLAQHACCEGNFDVVMEYILEKLPLENNALTYSQGPYLFHYIRVNGITYICITDDIFQRSRSFLFLLEIKRRFQGAYGSGSLSALPHVIKAEFSTVLANQMQEYSSSNAIDMSVRAQIELDELKEIMAKNIDNTRMNGERDRLLVINADGTRVGRSVVVITTEQARAIRNRSIMFWTFLIVAHVLVIYALGSIICGGPSWKECGSVSE